MKYMQILVFFDLPVKKESDRKIATSFRNFLLKDGYNMLQYSVYCRICGGLDGTQKHLKRLSSMSPKKGSVRVMTVTDKQFREMKILVGEKIAEEEVLGCQQLTFL